MLEQRLPALVPPLPEAEALESAALLSANGQFRPALWARRAFRAPHHSVSAAALIGGGSPPRPGEFIAMAPEAQALLHVASTRLAWSGRSFHRVLRITRAIADLAGSDAVLATLVGEAIQWRRALPGQGG